MYYWNVTVVARQPSNRDQVAGHVQSTLRPVPDVVQGRVLDVPPAHSTTRVVAVEDVLPNLRRHEAQAFEFGLRTHSIQPTNEIKDFR